MAKRKLPTRLAIRSLLGESKEKRTFGDRHENTKAHIDSRARVLKKPAAFITTAMRRTEPMKVKIEDFETNQFREKEFPLPNLCQLQGFLIEMS